MEIAYKSRSEVDLERARQELSALLAQKENLEIRIAKQQRRVAAYAALIDESEFTDEIMELNLGGLTDAVRSVLRAGPKDLTPVQVRDRLRELYFPVREYKNFMASLHSVLNRLVEAGEAEELKTASVSPRDETAYQWLAKFPKALRNCVPRE